MAEHCRAALRDGLAIYGVDARARAFRTQRPAVARLAWSLLDDRKERTIRKVGGTRLRRLPTYEIDATPQPATRKPAARCDRRMELRGAFLACGSLASPARGYHLEFVPPNDAVADRLVALLRAEGFAPKTASRKNRRIVYFKDIDAITEFLAAIGASQAVFALEDVRALKETKNRIHRLVNTEAANVDRAMSAAVAQREAIALVADAYGFAKLTTPLREIAELRLAHPTETLAELGRRCNPAVGKSTANNRIATLLRLARTLP
ncbi:MAG: DNA-binding protein WhiA [Candidatus Eremiobacteraeota bacterium]|nr:DNA-binding protein WhiA [Candidatus Eremiobacteraeota bacterium]